MKGNKLLQLIFIFSLVLCYNCNRSPYASSNRLYRKQAKQYAKLVRRAPLQDSIVTGQWIGTVNFNIRKPNFVILHHTAQNSCEQTLRTFTTVKSQVSAHYVICKDGTIHHMLNDYLRAWQAGISKWGNNTDINSSSIGIEIDNNGFEPFTGEQISSLLSLLSSLKKAYSIPTANFIGHEDIAPGRKVDPNVYFPWKQLSDSGFGIWWSDTTHVVVPPDFKPMQALRIIGYDLKDSVAVIQTFKRKYEQVEDKNAILTEGDKKILYTLYSKFE